MPDILRRLFNGGSFMSQKSWSKSLVVILFISAFFLTSPVVQTAQKKVLAFQDIMKFREIHHPVISEDGNWLAYNVQPDRGDGEVIVFGVNSNTVFTIERGSQPQISKNARWVAAGIKPKAVELEKAGKSKPKQGMALLETASGKITRFERVQSFAFSEDSQWLAVLHHKEEKPEKEGKDFEEEAPAEKVKANKKRKGAERKSGSLLVLRRLETGEELKISHVLSYAFDKSNTFLAYAVAGPDGKDNGLFAVDLTRDGLPRIPIVQKEKGIFAGLAWTEKGSRLAFLSRAEESENEKNGCFSLWIWDGETKEKTLAADAENTPEGWMIPEKNRVFWSRGGRDLFFGFKPADIHKAVVKENEEKEKEGEEKGIKESDLFDPEKILETREVDVWHWNDPFIKTHQKNMWSRVKDLTYTAVYHTDTKQFVPLADREMPRVERNENPDYALGYSDVPYRKEVTWYGRMFDLYRVNINDGTREKIASRLEDRSSLSPQGRYAVYYKDKHWHLFDGKTGKVLNLTDRLEVPFYDEDHDYPEKVPSYGTAGWLKDDEAVLIYDKHDIWQFDTNSGKASNITGGKGRQSDRTFRILRLDPEKQFFEKKDKLLLSSYHNKEKHFGFFSCDLGTASVTKLLEEKKKCRFLAKAEKADVLMYTQESFEEFPDIWVADREFSSPKKISEANPQISEFAWGKPELVEWLSLDGIPLQGVLIKPAGYVEGKRYPVIVYFYRFFSQRMYEFNQMVVNHRPNFPFYTSNGYAVFLPDVRFDVGYPGYSATKCWCPVCRSLSRWGLPIPALSACTAIPGAVIRPRLW